MMIEQIRYHVAEDNIDSLIEARRALNGVREGLGLPQGRILVSDPVPDGGPAVVWQCAYEADADMGAAEAALMGNADYEDARARLGELVERVELELYSVDEGS